MLALLFVWTFKTGVHLFDTYRQEFDSMRNLLWTVELAYLGCRQNFNFTPLLRGPWCHLLFFLSGLLTDNIFELVCLICRSLIPF